MQQRERLRLGGGPATLWFSPPMLRLEVIYGARRWWLRISWPRRVSDISCDHGRLVRGVQDILTRKRSPG